MVRATGDDPVRGGDEGRSRGTVGAVSGRARMGGRVETCEDLATQCHSFPQPNTCVSCGADARTPFRLFLYSSRSTRGSTAGLGARPTKSSRAAKV